MAIGICLESSHLQNGSMEGIGYSAGQQMMGMGADLVEVGDNYSIQTGSEDDWDYYGKVIDDDTIRIVTVMLRYAPEHDGAVEPLREWVKNYNIKKIPRH